MQSKRNRATGSIQKSAGSGGGRIEKANGTPAPRSLKISEGGVQTGNQFAHLMSALMSDVIDGRIAPQVCSAACNAGGKLLKVVEMQMKYGTKGGGSGTKALVLAR